MEIHLAKEIESLEQKGNFLALYQKLRPLPEERLTPQTLASFTRAAAFLGYFEEAKSGFDKLQNLSLNPESEIILLLARARLARINGGWDQARIYAESALLRAQSLQNSTLIGDAKFALASAIVELGHVFLGASLFQELRKNEELSSYRRGLAAFNESWILWDLGQAQKISMVSSQVPAAFRPRIELVMALLSGDLDLIESWAFQGPPLETAPSEIPLITLFLTEAFVVFGLTKKHAPWLRERLKAEILSENPLERAVASRCLKLLGDSVEIEKYQTQHWREFLRITFLDFLLKAQSGSTHLKEFWQCEIAPVLDEHHLQTPLLPSLYNKKFIPATSWEKAFSKFCKIESTLLPKNINPVELVTLLESSLQLVWSKNGQKHSLCLKKYPVSWKLLNVLAGSAGRKTEKSYIHHQLTASRYQPDLHDNRLHQLLRRLSSLLKKQGCPPLWCLPGDNHILLLKKIEVLVQ